MSEQRPWNPGDHPGAPGPPPPQGGDPWGFGGFVAAPRPGIVPLRPLELGELLDGSLQILRAHPRLVLGTAAILAVISELVQIPVRLAVGGDALAAIGRSSTPDLSVVADLISTGITINGVQAAVGVVTTSVLTGLLMVVVSRAVLGAPVEGSACWQAARPRIPGLLGLSLVLVVLGLLAVAVGALPAVLVGVLGGPLGLTIVLGFLGFLAILAALVAIGTLFSLAAPAYVLEGVGVVEALRRSRHLVAGRFWGVLGILLLAGIITGVVALIVVFPFSLVAGAAAGPDANPYTLLPLLVTALGTIIATAVTAPFQAGVSGLLYVDQRMRREGFDLELRRAAQAS